MTKFKSRRRLFAWIAGIMIFLVLVLGGIGIYLGTKWKPLLSDQLKQSVYTNSDSLYRIDFKDIHLNLFTGSVVLDSLRLMPDTNVYNQMRLQRTAPTHLFRIKVDYLKFSRIQILNAYFNKKINLKSIILTRPSIDMVYHKVKKLRDTTKEERTLYQQISKAIKAIQISSAKVVDADFDYYNGTKKLYAVKKLNVNVQDILVDSLAQFDSTRVFHAKNIGFNLAGYQSVTKDKMYTLKIDTVNGSVNSKTLKIKGFKLVPNYAELPFSRKYRVQKDRYDLAFEELRFNGVDFISLNADGNLNVRSVEIGPGKVAVFLNRELPPPNIDKGRNYPHVALMRLPIPTFVDSIRLKKVNIAYTEYNPKSKAKGTLRLDRLTGQITNVTNDSLALLKNNHAYADLTSYLFGTGKLRVKIDFNLTAQSAPFSYEGEIGAFDMKLLNPLSTALGAVAIENGNVKRAHFSVQANNRTSSGRVSFNYSDLKVKLLKDGERQGGDEKGLLSFLANAIVLKSDNPSGKEVPRTANISYSRVNQASFFNLMWKSVFVGIREIVGIGMIPMKPMEKPGITKKEERKQRREARREKN